ncbi:hypothetical protein FACS1894167_11070 [Synergistales bacterium]|nr:hypothetical protein FACS1894167_11070 [Synergistales bacterium]GHV54489.1 hypothetical protein FACS1894216_14630 [Synergistales bacterium]
MALVLSLIQALGYNVFDTSEVFPEYITAKGNSPPSVLIRRGGFFELQSGLK